VKALYYFKRALSLPPHIVFRKIIRKLKIGYASRKKFYLDTKKTTFATHCLFSHLNRYIQKIDLALLPKDAILNLNGHFLKHEFDLLGSGWVQVFHGMKCKGIEGFHYRAQEKRRINEPNLAESERIQQFIQQPFVPIDWQLDFKSGYRWNEDTWSKCIEYGHQIGADVKVPWELSRMQHLVQLAWGYALEKDQIYITEFQNQILDFISANPPRYGVNWSCTMDVGIRIANWLIAYDLLRAYDAPVSEEFEKVFIRSVYEHGHHIFHHLEWDPFLRSNHYLANIAGLLFVVAYLPSSLETAKWRTFAIQELEQEVLSQFHPDGSNFEGSTSYHRLSAEMVVYATALHSQEFSEEYLKRIDKMAEFIRDITKPDGTIIQIGDNDSGRFIKMFPDTDVLDHRYLIGAIKNKSNLTTLIEGQLRPVLEKEKRVAAYPDFGIYIQNQDPWFLAVRCGSIGQKGNGGHAHNDQLSFELSVKGVSMIVDPGTYVYTPLPDARRRFRSTSMHNTLSIKGKEQNLDVGLFQLTDRAKAEVIEFGERFFVGEHHGFGSTHRRTLKISGSTMEGIDECNEETKEIYFHFAPGWTGILLNEKQTEWSCDSLKVMISANVGTWKIEEGEYSRAYGEKQQAFVLVLTTHSKSTAWKITPSKEVRSEFGLGH